MALFINSCIIFKNYFCVCCLWVLDYIITTLFCDFLFRYKEKSVVCMIIILYWEGTLLKCCSIDVKIEELYLIAIKVNPKSEGSGKGANGGLGR